LMQPCEVHITSATPGRVGVAAPSAGLAEGVAHPATSLAIEGHDIEATMRQFALPGGVQKVPRRTDQPCALAMADAGKCAPEACTPAGPYLHEHQHAAILHQQIDFPSLAAQIDGKQAKAPVCQIP